MPPPGPPFDTIDTWVFDLDNTLYPSRSHLFDQCDARMQSFISNLLGVAPEEARGVQKTLYIEHGTTLRGLMERHNVEPEEFLDFVHDIDFSPVEASPALGDAIRRLPGRKLIFTNATRPYAEEIVGRLGIHGHFEAIFDIADAGYVPKPARAAYERMIAAHGVDAPNAIMFEDVARNLIEAHSLGMTTVWVRPEVRADAEPHERLSHEGADGDHIHHTTDDLTAFLDGL